MKFNNIIPLGDHCAASIILKELGIRKTSYPFDWTMMTNINIGTSIIYHIKLLEKLLYQNESAEKNIWEIVLKTKK